MAEGKETASVFFGIDSKVWISAGGIKAIPPTDIDSFGVLMMAMERAVLT